MSTVTFAQWFEESFRRVGEPRTTALARLHVATNCGPMTLKRAIAGQRVRPATAETLAAVTEGKVTRESIVFGAAAASGAQATPVTETAAA
jgi:hypothetical protein